MYENQLPEKNSGEFPQYVYEQILQRSCETEQILGKELVLCFDDLNGHHEFQTCYGDICKIVNVLRDYSRILEMVCDDWGLQGYHQALYKYYADKLREISGKYQKAIGYDYDAAIKKCQKKKERQARKDDIGEDALTQFIRKIH